MGGGKGGGGKLPDYEQLIKDSAYYNRNTQIGPSGGLFWSPDRTTATQVLSPEAQAQLNLQNIISQYALGGLAGGMFGVTPEMLAAGTTVPWYQQGGVLGNNGGLGGGIEFPPNWNLDSNGPFYRELMAGGAGGAGGGYGATGAAGVPDFSLMPEGWTQGIDASQFLSNPFTNLDMAPEATNFLKGLLGTGGGGSNYSLSAGGGGGGMSLQGLAPLVSFDANGNPNIGPGLMSQLNLGSLPDFADAGDLMGARNRAEKAAFDRAMALIIQSGINEKLRWMNPY